MERRFNFSIGEYYHIYNRGVEGRSIFQSNHDRARFVKLLYLSNGTEPYKFDRLKNLSLHEIERGKPLVAIGAYVLMPNHFHLLVREVTEGGTSKFMEKLATGYSSYFNKINERKGVLFQSRFKAEHVDRDEYLKYLYAYIHLNPIKLIDAAWKEKGIKNLNQAKQYLEGYHFSSFEDYTGGTREERLILSKDEFPEYFSDPQEFSNFVHDWLAYKEEAE